MEENCSEEPVTEKKEEPTLTLALLLNVKKILDIAVSRGAFKPEELTTVGTVYDQFTASLQKLSEQSNTEKA